MPITPDGLYHKSTGLPQIPDYVFGFYTLNHTTHAIRAAQTDRFAGPGGIRLPALTEVDEDSIVEVEFKDNQIVKLVTRSPYGDGRDIALVFSGLDWATRVATLRTAWLNVSSDKHPNLRTSRYARA